MHEVMKEEYKKMVIEFPVNSSDFEEGLILLDEAVGRFAQCQDDVRAYLLETLISSVVLQYADEKEEKECECCCK